MKKKNLLFIIPSLAAGGGEKSLVNLLAQINYHKYNVDLFLFSHEGLFMDIVPKEVQILPLPETYKLFCLSFFPSVKNLLLKGNLSVAINRVIFSLKNKTKKNVSTNEQYTWKNISRSLGKIEKKYDVAIGFLEKTSTYFCVDKVDALKKIGWVHIDYDKLGMDPKFDFNYFSNLNKIVTVSEECASIIKQRFPRESSKVNVIYNIVSPSMIYKLAGSEGSNIYEKKENEIIILSIGRLHYQKGFELAIESCKKLIDKGYIIRWNIIGDGEERERLTKMIQDNNLCESFILLGLKSNPYPYIQQADIYVQPSKFEGKSIAIDEAKILKKPIVVTNFSTAKDQINHGVDGLIAEMNSDSILENIEMLINDTELKESLISNLSKLKLGTEEEINKFYGLLS